MKLVLILDVVDPHVGGILPVPMVGDRSADETRMVVRALDPLAQIDDGELIRNILKKALGME